MESRTRIITCNSKDYLVTGGVHLFGVIFEIQGGGPPTTLVHLFDNPFEESEAEVKTAFNALSRVKCVKPQAYLSRPSISMDTVLTSLVMENLPPRDVLIRGYYCRVWYGGQPLICDVFRKEGIVPRTVLPKTRVWSLGTLPGLVPLLLFLSPKLWAGPLGLLSQSPTSLERTSLSRIIF